MPSPQAQLATLASAARGGDRAALDALLGPARGGDRAALEALLSAVAPQVARFGRRVCGSGSADADDALQDALVSIARSLPGFEGRSSFSSWMFTLVRSACARRRRVAAARPHESLDELAGASDPQLDPEMSAERAQMRHSIERALDALSEEHREVLAMRDIEGLSAEEAAAVLELSVPALKSRLHRARVALRAELLPIFAPGAMAPSASCPDVLAALSAKLEDDLAAEACTLLEAHVGGCAACGALCDTLRRAVGLCHELRDGGASEAALRAHVRAAVVEALGPASPVSAAIRRSPA